MHPVVTPYHNYILLLWDSNDDTSISTKEFKVEALWFKSLIVFLENLVLGTFICADNESKIKEIGWRLHFWDTGVAKTTYFLSKSHDLPHKVIQEVRQININVLQKVTKASFIFLIFTYVKVYFEYVKITK